VQPRNSKFAYGYVARVLHWSSVALLLGVVVLGTQLADIPDEPDAPQVLSRHVSLGLLLLGVMVARFVWRLCNPNPVLSYALHDIHKRGAISVHWFIYAVVIFQCCLGLAQLLADGEHLVLFEVVGVRFPAFGDVELRERLNDVHKTIANAIYVVIAVHIAGAIYHQLFGVLDVADHDA